MLPIYCTDNLILNTISEGEQIIYANQTVRSRNPESRVMTSKWNKRQMKDWYEMGAHVINVDK